jgi:hypothetical protein
MERIPGGQDGEPSADEEARTPALLGEGRSISWRVGAGLATAAAIVGLATVALAYGVAPWHRAAAILSDYPQQQGHKGTKLFHSMQEDLATHLRSWQRTYRGSREIYVENADVFNVGDNIVILDPSGDISMNEEGVIARVDPGKLTLERPVSKSLADGAQIIVQADPAPAPAPAPPVGGNERPGYGDYDCDAGYSNWAAGWSDNKKKACCQWEGKGCSFDCNEGFAMWESGWSPEKKKYCCYTEQRGCDSPDQDFDCAAGFENWMAGWSENKKRVCCATEGKGCTFDCTVGYSLWTSGWSEDKKNFCCQTEQKGCGTTEKRDFWAGVLKAFSIMCGVVLCVLALVLAIFLCSKACPNWSRACQTFCQKLCSPVSGGKGRHGHAGSGRPSSSRSRSSDGSLQGMEWIFKPGDDEPVLTLSKPDVDAAQSGFRLEPRERFFVSQEVTPKDDPGGSAVFLKLADGRGWCLDREPGHEMCYKIFEPVDELWRFYGKNGRPIAIREEPDYDAEGTGDYLNQGDKFVVSEIQADEEGVLWLMLADDRGWLFDEDQSGQLLCKRLVDETWEYQPEDELAGREIAIRSSPDINSPDIGKYIFPGESFQVEETVVGDDDILYLKLDQEAGWLFETHPEYGTLCYKVA